MRTTGTALIFVGLLLAGCQGDAEPAPPPPSEDALTTTSTPTEDPGPTTSAPPDNASETSVAPTTEVPETETSEPPESSGPPELPAEATEDSEAGAEAFALHYIDTINYTSMYPEVGLLEPLASPDCEPCANYEAAAAYGAEHGERTAEPMFTIRDTVPLHNPKASTAIVSVGVLQTGQDVLGDEDEIVEVIPARRATMIFDLEWGGEWAVVGMQADVD